MTSLEFRKVPRINPFDVYPGLGDLPITDPGKLRLPSRPQKEKIVPKRKRRKTIIPTKIGPNLPSKRRS